MYAVTWIILPQKANLFNTISSGLWVWSFMWHQVQVKEKSRGKCFHTLQIKTDTHIHICTITSWTENKYGMIRNLYSQNVINTNIGQNFGAIHIVDYMCLNKWKNLDLTLNKFLPLTCIMAWFIQ